MLTYLGEYLIHGKLFNTDNLWQAVTLETLITAGLWKVFIELHDPEHWHKLNGQVKHLRYEYFKEPHAITAASLKILRDLAECFGRKWRGAIIVALVASKKREISLKSIKALYSNLMHGDIEVPQLPWYEAGLRMCQCGLYDIEESWQFMELLYWLYDRGIALESAKSLHVFLDNDKPIGVMAESTRSKDFGIVEAKANFGSEASKASPLSVTFGDSDLGYNQGAKTQQSLITPVSTP